MSPEGYIDPDIRSMGDPRYGQAELNDALARAQGEFPVIGRDRTVEVQTKTGGKYKFAYAPLEAILPKVQPILAKYGLSVVQLLEKGPALRTELRHSAGGVVGGSFPFVAPESPQALGSLITYLRRYALVALLGLSTEEDDDGNVASGHTVAPKETPQTVNPIDTKKHARIGALCDDIAKASGQEKKKVEDDSRAWIKERYGKKSRADLTDSQGAELIKYLEGILDLAKAPIG